MATYAELLAIRTTTGGPLLDKIKIAVIIACDKIRQEAGATTNHANRLLWARATLIDSDTAANRMLLAVLAQNVAQTSAAILAASDAAVQTAVDAAVDLLAQG